MIVTLADIVSPVIKESINKYNLMLVDGDSSSCLYEGEGIQVFIITDITIGKYIVEVNDKPYHRNVNLDLINDLIITEIEMP
jgi:hypothetical protein